MQTFTFNQYSDIGSYAFGNCTGLKDIYFCTAYGTDQLILYSFKSASDSFSYVTATVYYPVGYTLPANIENLFGGGDVTWQESYSGICGAKMHWQFTPDTGELYLYGDGALNSLFSGRYQPWYPFWDKISSVVIEEGVEILPSYIFEYISNLTEVTLPHSLKELACNAFNNCSSLNNLLIPQSVTKLSREFNRCSILSDIYYLGTAEQWKTVIDQDNATNSMTIHTLTAQSTPPTCTEPGIQTYYAFENSSIYPGKYDAHGTPLSAVAQIPPLGHDFAADGTCKNGCGVIYSPITFDVNILYDDLAMVDFSCENLPETCVIYIAAYNGDTLSQIKQISTSAKGTYFVISNENKFKAFVWSSSENISPFCRNAEKIIK